MWLISWKKYEYSAVATGVSMMGNIVILFGAILLGMWAATLNGVLGVVAGIAAYVGLKIGLNKLTDRIAKSDAKASANRFNDKWARDEAKQQARDAELLKALAEETDQDALYKAVHDSFNASTTLHSRITREQQFAAAQRLDDEHIKKLLASCSGCFNYNRGLQKRCLEKGEPSNPVAVGSMTRLIGMVRDDGERERLMKYYYLTK